MAGRGFPEDFGKKKVSIVLDNKLFDFANKLKVNDKGILDVRGKISSERKSEDESIKTFKIISASLLKEARI